MPDSNHTAVGQDCPIVQTLAITPADSNLVALPRALWIGNGGSVEILAAGDTVASMFLNVSSGTLLPVRALQVKTGTTATGIIALY